ncbi:MAG: FadR/GntR family transcriptional regulator [Leucobacter sp.]
MRIGKTRVSDLILAELRRRIAAGVWTDGEQLPTERELAAEFEVSPNTIREAIRALGAAGLVEVRQGSGAFVTLATSQIIATSLGTLMQLRNVSLNDVLALDRYLHARVVHLAVQNAEEADIERLEATVADSYAGNAAQNAAQVGAFLEALTAAAHDPLLAGICWALDRSVVESVAAVYADNAAALEPELIAIRRIRVELVNAIRARDEDRAQQAISDYYDASEAITSSRDELSTVRVSDERWSEILNDLAAGYRRAPGS